MGERSGANSGQEQGDSAGNEEGGATGRRGDAEAVTPRLVLNGVGVEAPQPYRRKAQGTFVLTIVDADEPPTDVLRTTYPILVRNLSNMVMYVVWSGEQCSAHFVTLELGHYYLTYRGDEARFFRRIYEMLYPLVTAELVINNEFCPDLPPDLWAGDATTRSITRAGQQLDAWNLLPAPFPIDELVPARDLRHIQLLYGIGGLSYGNISAREDASRFWMSASGVNKADLRVIGRDILLVKGFDAARNVILLSVPPRIKPRRVSVDAIEHWMIYTEHPEVQAILHVHAWVEGVPSTVINYPCGTRQLARAVAALVRQADDPARAIIGLKNHGLTITGRSLDEIFERIRGRINQEVPMEPPAISDEEPVST
ncbi:MAG: class II aldolase/adducin family protein [Chloroflexi bacterium]|nr:class II aldolase/adducin family protein [Chloroflexota bacterium]